MTVVDIIGCVGFVFWFFCEDFPCNGEVVGIVVHVEMMQWRSYIMGIV